MNLYNIYLVLDEECVIVLADYPAHNVPQTIDAEMVAELVRRLNNKYDGHGRKAFHSVRILSGEKLEAH